MQEAEELSQKGRVLRRGRGLAINKTNRPLKIVARFWNCGQQAKDLGLQSPRGKTFRAQDAEISQTLSKNFRRVSVSPKEYNWTRNKNLIKNAKPLQPILLNNGNAGISQWPYPPKRKERNPRWGTYHLSSVVLVRACLAHYKNIIRHMKKKKLLDIWGGKASWMIMKRNKKQ